MLSQLILNLERKSFLERLEEARLETRTEMGGRLWDAEERLRVAKKRLPCFAIVLGWDGTPMEVWLPKDCDPIILAHRAMTVRGTHSVPIMVSHMRLSFDGGPGVRPIEEDFYLRPLVVHREDGETVYWLLLTMLAELTESRIVRERQTVAELVSLVEAYEFGVIIGARDKAGINGKGLRFLEGELDRFLHIFLTDEACVGHQMHLVFRPLVQRPRIDGPLFSTSHLLRFSDNKTKINLSLRLLVKACLVVRYRAPGPPTAEELAADEMKRFILRPSISCLLGTAGIQWSSF